MADDSGASGNIQTNGGGFELGPLKAQAPSINASGSADKGTVDTIGNVAKVAALADSMGSRKLGGQIKYTSPPLKIKTHSLGEEKPQIATQDALIGGLTGGASHPENMAAGAVGGAAGGMAGSTLGGTVGGILGPVGSAVGSTLGGLVGGKMGGDFAAKPAGADDMETPVKPDVIERFLQKHSTGKEPIAAQRPGTPAAEDLKEDNQLLTSTQCNTGRS